MLITARNCCSIFIYRAGHRCSFHFLFLENGAAIDFLIICISNWVLLILGGKGLGWGRGFGVMCLEGGDGMGLGGDYVSWVSVGKMGW